MTLPKRPAFIDHCIRMSHDERQALVVGPVGPARVAQGLDAHGLELAGILVTRPHGASRRRSPIAQRCTLATARLVDGSGTAVLAAPGPWKKPFR